MGLLYGSENKSLDSYKNENGFNRRYPAHVYKVNQKIDVYLSAVLIAYKINLFGGASSSKTYGTGYQLLGKLEALVTESSNKYNVVSTKYRTRGKLSYYDDSLEEKLGGNKETLGG